MAKQLNINFKVVRLAAIFLLVLIGVFTSFYTVSADAQAAVLRFGKPCPKPRARVSISSFPMESTAHSLSRSSVS